MSLCLVSDLIPPHPKCSLSAPRPRALRDAQLCHRLGFCERCQPVTLWEEKIEFSTWSRRRRPTCPEPSERRLLPQVGLRPTAPPGQQPQGVPCAGKKCVGEHTVSAVRRLPPLACHSPRGDYRYQREEGREAPRCVAEVKTFNLCLRPTFLLGSALF